MIRRILPAVKANWGAMGLLCALATSLATNVWFVATAGPRDPHQPPPQIDPTGSFMKSVEASTLDGKRVTLRFDDPRETVAYFLSPDCSFCLQNYDSIVGLGKADTVRRYVGLVNGELTDSETLATHLKERPLPFEVFRVEDATWLTEFGLTVTPTTLVMDRRAEVIRLWRGAFSARRMKEIEAYFGFKLPPLAKR